ncbi:hypothetical protein CCYA_CCYA06G1771 [Cyanidiococcus yangmingshanensis]|nr:hypothetical protein CCYA_CCYA06G1771 [Cyanidiococcus yangmingshanensis]
MPEPIWINTSELQPIFQILNRGDEQLLEAHLQAEPRAVSVVDSEGRTALHWASAHRRNLVPVLLRYGADPTIQDDAGWSTLHIAAASSGPGSTEVFRALLSCLSERHKLAGALAATTRTGATPLLLAASKGSLDILREILNNVLPADLDEMDLHGNTPLMRATSAGHLAVVRLLLDKGARVAVVNERTGQNVLHLACAEGRADIIQMLAGYATEDAWEMLDKQHQRPRDLLPLAKDQTLDGNPFQEKKVPSPTPY